MNGSDSFDDETLQLLDEIEEVHVETRHDNGAPEHRAIIWVMVVDGEVFVRSVRGPRGRWYREISANPEGALHAGNHRIPVRAAHATDGSTVEAVSEAIRGKYGHSSPGSTRAMLSPETLPTTLKLLPV
ncbi:MAG: DUF2255 family protein [Actinomycetota bacterium]|nr:DUF2255 family protein [Actinomycetota bacterium]